MDHVRFTYEGPSGVHDVSQDVTASPQEPKDADKLPDDDLAKLQWDSHIARNDSPIVDHCLVSVEEHMGWD